MESVWEGRGFYLVVGAGGRRTDAGQRRVSEEGLTALFPEGSALLGSGGLCDDPEREGAMYALAVVTPAWLLESALETAVRGVEDQLGLLEGCLHARKIQPWEEATLLARLEGLLKFQNVFLGDLDTIKQKLDRVSSGERQC